MDDKEFLRDLLDRMEGVWIAEGGQAAYDFAAKAIIRRALETAINRAVETIIQKEWVDGSVSLPPISSDQPVLRPHGEIVVASLAGGDLPAPRGNGFTTITTIKPAGRK